MSKMIPASIRTVSSPLKLSGCAAVAIVLAGFLPASAGARGYLPVARARRAAATYERTYWRGHGMHLQVDACRRLGVRRVSCAAKLSRVGETVVVRDSITLLPGGDLRVHPGEVATTITLLGSG